MVSRVPGGRPRSRYAGAKTIGLERALDSDPCPGRDQPRGFPIDGRKRSFAARAHYGGALALGRELWATFIGRAALADIGFQLRAHRNSSYFFQHVVPAQPGQTRRARVRHLDVCAGLHLQWNRWKPGKPLATSARGGRRGLGSNFRIGWRIDRSAVPREASISQSCDSANIEKLAHVCRLQSLFWSGPGNRQFGAYWRPGGGIGHGGKPSAASYR